MILRYIKEVFEIYQRVKLLANLGSQGIAKQHINSIILREKIKKNLG
jgi:hypothetical protein